MAELTTTGDAAFPELRAIYEHNAGLRVAPVISSYTLAGILQTGIVLFNKEGEFEGAAPLKEPTHII